MKYERRALLSCGEVESPKTTRKYQNIKCDWCFILHEDKQAARAMGLDQDHLAQINLFT